MSIGKDGKVHLWDSKFRSNESKLELSPTFDKDAKTASGNPSKAWDNAKQEAIDAIKASNLSKADKNKYRLQIEKGDLVTHTVGDGANFGKEITQVYQGNNKV